MHGEGLEWSREQDGCVDLPVCGAGEAAGGCQADSSESLDWALILDGGSVYRFLTRLLSSFLRPLDVSAESCMDRPAGSTGSSPGWTGSTDSHISFL